MNVNSVRNHARNPFGIRQHRARRVRRAMIERRHRVKEMRGVTNPRAVARVRLFYRRHRVSHADDDTLRCQFLDERERVGQLGREGDEPHAICA